MKRLRIAVIGAGHLGRIHTRLLQTSESVELAGVVDPADDARQSAAEEFNVPGYADFRELTGRIDAAVVATTTGQHFHVGRELLSQGIHLLVEKPITTCVDQADELVRLANEHGVVLQVGHVERFNPAWNAVTPYMRRPRYIEAVRTSGYTFRSTDISVVLDLMIHDLDLILSLVRSPVVDVDAIGATIFGPHEDMAHAHLRFANGCIANLNVSRTSFEAQRSMQVITDRSYVSLDFAASTAKLIRPGPELLRGKFDVHELSRQEKDRVRQSLFTDLLPLEEVSVEKTNAILEEQRDFVDCILADRKPLVSGEQARDCLAVAERILVDIDSRSRSPRKSAPRRPQWTHGSRRRKAG